ncbi:hypothetical protein ACHAWF_009058 [Thalassiosira exigua]
MAPAAAGPPPLLPSLLLLLLVVACLAAATGAAPAPRPMPRPAIPRRSSAAAFASAAPPASSARVAPPPRGRRRPTPSRATSLPPRPPGMALTEEFVEMKVNGDERAPSPVPQEAPDGEEGRAERARRRDTIPEALGRAALSAAQSLARATGSDASAAYYEPNEYDDEMREAWEMLEEDEAHRGGEKNEKQEKKKKEKKVDGFGKGALGLAGIASGKEGTFSSRRSKLIDWQRRELSGVRREVGTRPRGAEATRQHRLNRATFDAVSSSVALAARQVVRGGRMTPLIDSLPSRRKSDKRGKKKKRGGRDRTDEANVVGSSDVPPREMEEGDGTLIASALQTLERDMALLDNVASLQPQLSAAEVGLLLGAVVASGIGPAAFPGTSVTEVLAPAAAAFTASITIGSEYIGRVAVADGKEIAANTIQCAAEAEAFLANAERVKAITPLCVGVGATCASLTLLTPTLVDAMKFGNSVIMITELYLLLPLVSVLAAAVANLALEETRGFANRAINVGVRRFSKSGKVGRTWLSSSEQVKRNSQSKTDRWWSFAGSVLPAPIVGSVLGGPSLSAKCIVVAALAAAQSAYCLAQAEGVIARATDAVALKARSAAVCDTYANQGARNSAILPFTSALSAFCAAATAATVELPFLDTISALYGTMGEVAVVSIFPVLSSAFAAAAAVSKARCEVDAEAAAQAASTLALEYDGEGGEDPVLEPFRAVGELVRLAVRSGWRSVGRGGVRRFASLWRMGRRAVLGFRWRRRWKERAAAGNGASEEEGAERSTGGKPLVTS